MTTNTANFALPYVDETSAVNEYVPLTALNVPDVNTATRLCTDANALNCSERKKIPSNVDLTAYADYNRFKTLYAEADFITPLGAVSKTVYNANESGTVLTELVNNGGLFGVWFIANHYFNEDGTRRYTTYGFAPATTVKHVAEDVFAAGVKTVL